MISKKTRKVLNNIKNFNKWWTVKLTKELTIKIHSNRNGGVCEIVPRVGNFCDYVGRPTNLVVKELKEKFAQ